MSDVTLRNLTDTVNQTIELSDRNFDNINAIQNIFARTAALRIVPEVFNNICSIQLLKHVI